MEYTIEQVCSDGFIRSIMDSGADVGTCSVIFSDKSKADLPIRKLIFNVLIWKPYIKLGIPITKEQVEDVTAIKSGTLADIASRQYKDILDKTDTPYMEIITYFWEVVNDVYNFIVEFMGPYQRSMSAFSLSKVQCHEKIKALTDVYIDPANGTQVGEIKIKQLSSQLIDVISTRGEIEDNVLIEFMETGSLKANQIPQQMLAYGCRSDIDDRMMGHIINESAMSGLKSVQDFAIESLSAKKSSYFNKVVIRNTQYFARVLRLNNLSLSKMYPGHCGSDGLLPITIPKQNVDQFYDKVCFLDGEKCIITEENAHLFADKRVSLISPIMCRHTDGVCEYCAGRGTKHPWAYMPQVHLGLFAATKVGRSISQMVLSAKHLIKTSSLTLTLNESTKKWFHVSGNDILFRLTGRSRLNGYKLKIPTDAIGYLSDLAHGVSLAESFSDIEYVDIIDPKGNSERLVVHEERFIPHLSKRFLKHISKYMAEVETTDDDYYIIPLDKFNPKYPLLNYIIVNDDMVAFTKEVESMLNTTIAEYSSVTNVLSDLTRILHSKTKINVFFVEVLLKAFICRDTHEEMFDITDSNNVSFRKMKDNIQSASVAAKLGHERLGSKDYFAEASTSVVPKSACELDEYFGF